MTGDTVWGAALPALYAHEDRHWWTQGMLACMAALLDTDGWTGGGAILDVGCGGGGALARLTAQQRVGVDLSPLALRHARRHPDLRLVRASVAALPLAPAQFDLVLALDSLDQRQVEMSAALAACAAQLRPGGRLLLRVSAHPWLYSTHDRLTGTALRLRLSDLRTLLAQAQLILRRLTYANCLLFPFAAARRWLLRRRDDLALPAAGALPAHDLNLPAPPLNRLFTRLLRLEALWLRRGFDLPWGLSLVALAARPGPLEAPP